MLVSPATLSLSCTAQGNPLPTISWMVESRESLLTLYFDNNVTDRLRIVFNEDLEKLSVISIFSVNSTRVTGSGNYSCKAMNRFGVSMSATSSVYIYCELNYHVQSITLRVLDITTLNMHDNIHKWTVAQRSSDIEVARGIYEYCYYRVCGI